MATYTTPVVFSADKLCIGEAQPGDVFPPALVPVSAQSGNLLRVADDGLVATADGLISQEADNILVSGAAGLYADMEKAVAENDKVLSVADNQIRATLSLEFTKTSELVLRGVDGAVVGSVRLPVVPGLPVIVEYLGDVTPPAGSVVIGGVVGQTGNYLHMRFLLNDDTLQDVFINFAKIFNLNIGNGLAFTSTGAVVVRPATGGGVIVDENGVSVSADYIRKVAEIVVAGSGQPLPGGGIVTDAATGMLKLDCGVVRDCVRGDGGLAESLIKPGGGLTTDSQGRLAVSCSAITPCIQGVVDNAIGGVAGELAVLRVDVDGIDAIATSAQAQAQLAAGKADEAEAQSAQAFSQASAALESAESAATQAQSAEDKADSAALAAAEALSKAEQALASEPDLSGYLPLSGGTMTGTLALPAVTSPSDTQAVPYQYIKDHFLAQNADILTALEETATDAQATAELAQSSATAATTAIGGLQSDVSAVQAILQTAQENGQIGTIPNLGDVDLDTVITPGRYNIICNTGNAKHQPYVFTTNGSLIVDRIGAATRQFVIYPTVGEVWMRQYVAGAWTAFVPISGARASLTIYISKSGSDFNTGFESGYPVASFARAILIGNALLKTADSNLYLLFGEGDWGTITISNLAFFVHIRPYDNNAATQYSDSLPKFSAILVYNSLVRIRSIGGGRILLWENATVTIEKGYKRVYQLYADKNSGIYVEGQNAATNILEFAQMPGNTNYDVMQCGPGSAIWFENYAHIKLAGNITGRYFLHCHIGSIVQIAQDYVTVDGSGYTFTGTKYLIEQFGYFSSAQAGTAYPSTSSSLPAILSQLPGTIAGVVRLGAVINGSPVGYGYAENYVAKAGDTMTGQLNINYNAPSIVLKDTRFETAGNTKIVTSFLQVLDKNSSLVGLLQLVKSTDGSYYLNIQSSRNISGTVKYSTILAGISAAGKAYTRAEYPYSGYDSNDTDIATTKWVQEHLTAAASASLSTTSSMLTGTYSINDPEPASELVSTSTELGQQILAAQPATLSLDDEAEQTIPGYVAYTRPFTEEELFEELRTRRNIKLVAYEAEVAKLQRKIRQADTQEEKAQLEERIALWDAYADALCALPDQDGAPWDGGGSETPWPEKPEA